ncbi:MAG TPA: MarR family transcriptional regulator [Jatrophihabitantaceae bacterium]|jgi:DNA-binding MarR family transcriptional regulator
MALRDLAQGWERYREAVADELGVGTSEVIALGFLYHDGPRTPSEIGQRLNLTSGSVTALLDRLEAAAYVTRSQNPDDRRSLLATATPAGRHAIQWFYEQLDGVIADALQSTPQLARADVITFAEATGEALVQQARASKEEQQ